VLFHALKIKAVFTLHSLLDFDLPDRNILSKALKYATLHVNQFIAVSSVC